MCRLVGARGASGEDERGGLSVGLQARVEVVRGGEEVGRDVEFARLRLGGAFEVRAGAVHTVPFGLEIPWETPVTTFLGRPVRGMGVGVTTELAIARAVDSSDLDPVQVHPLPAQQAVLDAFERLGFRFESAGLAQGRIHGTRQRLPFHQQIEFSAPPQYRGLSEVELSFVADDREMDVVLEMGRKPGPCGEGSDTYRSFTVGLRDFGGTDWAGCLNQWLAEVGGRRNWL
ncbi:sporulation protein [Streptomyces sp. NPDC001793]|uniref:sporulation protein n=1 Tax=Streptomyces sp. NPDC001793 TaxID=3154657 RepID=UPI00331D907D